MENIKKTSYLYIIFWGVFYNCIFLLFLKNSLSYLDPDFGWHFRFGEYVWLNKKIPLDQFYLWTLEGKTWVNHEWLSDTLLYLIWKIGGYSLVSVFFALIPTLVAFLVNQYVIKKYSLKSLEVFIFSSLLITYLIGILPNSGIRIQQISVLFLIFLLIILKKIGNKVFYRGVWWLIPLFYFWANMHAGFLLGLVIAFCWLLYYWLIFFINKDIFGKKIKDFIKEGGVKIENLKKISLVFLLAFLSTTITPYGIGLYGFLKDYKNTAYLSYIQEWQSLFAFLPMSNISFFQLCFIIISLSFIIWLTFFNKNKIEWWKTVLLLALILFSLKSVRHFPLFGAASLILVVGPAIKSLYLNKLYWPTRFIYPLIFICLILLGTLLGINISYKKSNDPFFSYCHSYPCGAVNFLKENEKYGELKIINDYGWGGYLIGVWPEKKLFIDGRLPQYPLKEHTLIEEYIEFNRGISLEEKLDAYGAGMILWRTELKEIKTSWFGRYVLMMDKTRKPPKDNVKEYLKNNTSWEIIYSDELASVYIKKQE